MEYVVFPMKGPGGKVAILLDYIVSIWSSEDGTSAYLGMNFEPSESIEVNVPFAEVMAWFDHYKDEGEDEDDGDVRDDVAGAASDVWSDTGVRLVSTEEAGG